MASIAEVAVLLLNRSLLAGDFEGFVEGVGGPAGAGDLVHFETLQRFAVHHAVNGFGEVVLMVLGNRGERVPNDIDGLDVAVLDGQMDVDGILAYRAVLAVDRVVAVLVVAGVLLVGRGGGRVGCGDELESEPSELSEPFDWDCDCSSCDFSVSPELPAYASSIGAALDSPHPASSAPATTSPAAANVADFFNVLFSVIFTLLKPPLTRGCQRS